MDTDPKGEAGAKKTPMQFIPLSSLSQVSHVFKLGAGKYGERNWLKNKVSINTYKGAILRHLAEYADGNKVDQESGQSHLAHIVAGCLIMLDAEAHGMLVDDMVTYHDSLVNDMGKYQNRNKGDGQK